MDITRNAMMLSVVDSIMGDPDRSFEPHLSEEDIVFMARNIPMTTKNWYGISLRSIVLEAIDCLPVVFLKDYSSAEIEQMEIDLQDRL